jgi:GDP/UDP-N,N'-diacetylbacillosamine 2-epimerase (hydrolysing)
MRIYLLTSSRADYGIYLPLIKKLKSDPYFKLKLVVFGTHLSKAHGYTLDQISADGFAADFQLSTMPVGDSPKDISESIGNTIAKFATLWEKEQHDCDLILCLGDRYEMFAAVAATVPFNLPVAHLHGGETTLGAIDNFYRHSITLMSKFHFASTDQAAEKIKQLTASGTCVWKVGALSLDNLHATGLLSKEEFKNEFGISLDHPVLVTFHPETVNFSANEQHITELISAMSGIEGQILITMPNADTSSQLIREKLLNFAATHSNVVTVESLGTRGYFTCLENCAFVLGNSSSGIIEAASFGKYVIDLGSRQKGREAGTNVIHCAIERTEIKKAIDKIRSFPPLSRENIYGDGKTADRIVTILKGIKLK